MPAAAIAAVEWVVAAIGAEAGSAALVYYAAEIAAAIVTVSAVYYVSEQQRAAQQDAKNAHNASLRDRYLMSRGATQARQMVLGRARVSGPLTFIGSYGANKEHLVFALVLAAHEIDAVEQIYFDNHPVLLDASGAVLGVQQKDTFSLSGVLSSATFTLASPPKAGTLTAQAVYGTTIVALTATFSGTIVTLSGGNAGQTGLIEVRYQPDPSPFTNGSVTNATDTFACVTASGTFTLSQTPAGPVSAIYASGTGADQYFNTATATAAGGNSYTFSTATGGGTAFVAQYQVSPSVSSKARIKVYLGGAGQVADPTMIAAFPTLWTSAHVGNGLAYLRIEFDYDPTAFPSGIPNVSAIVRGALVYDPRSALTAWSDNPALLLRYAATSPLCGRLATTLISDPAIITAANVCDTSTNYVVNGQTYVRKLFVAGVSAKTTGRPQDALNDLAQAMAGKWAFIDGLLRVKAGSYTTPVRTLDESWLHESQQVQIQPKHPRADIFNVVTGVFADASLDYQVSPMPRIAPAAYITEDGAELSHDLTMNAVQFSGQAQHIAGCALRDSRAGLTMTVLCNMRAYELEVFDVINVTLYRFGWVNKTFEVLDISWTLNGGIQLSLKATDATITALDASFLAFNPATATQLPSPWVIAAVPGLTAASGTAQLLRQSDGTIVSRILVSWGAIADQAVLSGGQIEIRYGLASTSYSAWTSLMVPGGDRQAYIPQSVKDLTVYVIQARAWNSFTSGQWSAPILVKVIGKTAPPADISGFTISLVASGVQVAWIPCTDADYKWTDVHLETAWNAATSPIFRGNANVFVLPYPPAGTYYFTAKHVDTSGNYSVNASAGSVVVPTVTAGSATWNTISGMPANIAALSGAEAIQNSLLAGSIASAGTTSTWAGTTGTGKPSDNASSDLNLSGVIGVVVSGNSVTATAATTSTNGSFRSMDSYPGGAYCSYVLVTSAAVSNPIIGLSDSIGAGNASIRYGIHASTNGNLYKYESGTASIISASWALGDVLGVSADGVTVRYSKNGVIVGTTAQTMSSTSAVYLNGQIFDPSSVIKNLRFGPLVGINVGNLPNQSQGGALNDDPGMTDLTAWISYGPGTLSVVALTDPAVGRTAFQCAGGQYNFQSRSIPVSPGKTYRASCYARYTVSGTNSLDMRLHCYNAAGSEVAYNVGVEGAVTTSGWVRYSGLMTPPFGSVTGVLSIDSNYAGTGTQQFQDVRIEEVINTDLIAHNAATDIVTTVLSHDLWTVPAGGSSNQHRLGTTTYTNYSIYTVDIEISFTCFRTYTNPSGVYTSSAFHFMQVFINGAFSQNFPSPTTNPEDVNNMLSSGSKGWAQSYVQVISIAPGAVISVESVMSCQSGFTGTTLSTDGLSLRLTAVKR